MIDAPEPLDAAHLAEHAGVDVGVIRHYTDLGLLTPQDGWYSESDIARVRLVTSCERAGLPLDGIAQTIERGLLTLGFLDLPQYRRFGTFSDRTYGQAAAEAGLSFGHLRRVEEALGLSAPGSEDDRVRENDLQLIRVLAISAAFGVPEEAVLRTVRVYADALRRITAAETQFYREHIEQPLIASGTPLGEAVHAASAYGAEWNTAGDASLLAMYHRHQESAWIGGLVARIEEALEQLGVYRRLERPPAMIFLDLAGYTRLTEERGDAAAADLAADLAGIAQATSQHHGGRPVKWLGDGIMFHFPDPGESVVAGLEMVDRTPDAGLPPAHVGIAAGPVVQQDGDFFGRTVNMAARLSATAGPSEVLVTGEVERVVSHERVRFEPVGPVELKGFASPVPLLRARWA